MHVHPLYLVIGVLVAGSIFLACSALGPSINPYLSVSQAAGGTPDGREVQVLATLEDWSTAGDGSLYLRLSDGNATLNATYRGVPPQGLARGQKIVAIGFVRPPDAMVANRLLTRCPSRYE